MDSKNISPSFPPSLPLESNRNPRHSKWVYGHNNTLSFNLSLIEYSPSTVINNYDSHAPGIRKAMKLLEIQFSHSNVSASPSVYNNEDVLDIYNNTVQMNNFNDADIPNLLVAGSSESHETPSNQTTFVTSDDVTSVGVYFKKKKVDDGRTHSLPHKKYGPYTCPKCYQVLATSQKFASHVTSNHYKFDSPEERKKRYMSRKKPDLQIPKLDNGQTTFVPIVPSTDRTTCCFLYQ
ncbi:uncharacterized protein LOC131648252 [Vicia villosa]|uniref:uncharacterized protein LOC131648252 n=1 Tax=Vicia villosa TaxID=3911 RepID=UPI00273B036E|nr:uncharacterized protein LOC131648252 [Vicia villosa]